MIVASGSRDGLGKAGELLDRIQGFEEIGRR